MSGPLRRPQPATWWLKRGVYFQFMMRELSALFVGAWLGLFLVLLHKLSQGPEAFHAYREFFLSPPVVAFHFVALAFALLHAFTWFNSTPKAIAVWRGEERLPDALLIVPNYVILAVVAAAVFWLVR